MFQPGVNPIKEIKRQNVSKIITQIINQSLRISYEILMLSIEVMNCQKLRKHYPFQDLIYIIGLPPEWPFASIKVRLKERDR